jgi:hypothetical protein
MISTFLEPQMRYLPSSAGTTWSIALIAAMSLAAAPAAAQAGDPPPPPVVQPPVIVQPTIVQPPAADLALPSPPANRVTPSEALAAAREILAAQRFQVTRVEIQRNAHVIYFRRRADDRGLGLGPIERLIIRPAGRIVTFEGAPVNVRAELKTRFGF